MEKSPRHLGQRLQMVRAARGLKQKEVAAQAEMTPRHLSLLEHSEQRLLQTASERVVKLARVLGVSVDYLLGESDDVDLERRAERQSAA